MIELARLGIEEGHKKFHEIFYNSIKKYGGLEFWSVFSPSMHKIKPYSLMSHDYCNCNGVALLTPKIVGLSHYYIEKGITAKDPELYLPEFIRELETESQVPHEQFKSVVVGGTEEHFRRIIKILKDCHIPIVAQYLDFYGDDEKKEPVVTVHDQTFQIPFIRQTKYSKKHIQIGDTLDQVVILSEDVGFIKLAPY